MYMNIHIVVDGCYLMKSDTVFLMVVEFGPSRVTLFFSGCQFCHFFHILFEIGLYFWTLDKDFFCVFWVCAPTFNHFFVRSGVSHQNSWDRTIIGQLCPVSNFWSRRHLKKNKKSQKNQTNLFQIFPQNHLEPAQPNSFSKIELSRLNSNILSPRAILEKCFFWVEPAQPIIFFFWVELIEPYSSGSIQKKKRFVKGSVMGWETIRSRSGWTLAQCDWRVVATGLKPLRLPRARNSGPTPVARGWHRG